MIKFGQWCVGACAVLSVWSAHAQDSCSDVFIRDLSNKVELQSSNDSSSALKWARCAKNNNSSGSSSGTSAGGSYGPFSANFSQRGGSNSSSSSSDCASSDSSDQASAALYYAQSVYRDVVEAWKECMLQRQEFACWAEKGGDGRRLTVHARWAILSGRPKVVSSSVAVGNRTRYAAFQQDALLFLGDNQVFVDRGLNEAVSVDITASPDNVAAKTCHVWVPSDEELSKPNLVVEARWSPSPPIGAMPPPGECTCVSMEAPRSPDGFPPPHAPYPAGSVAKVVNNCSSEVAVFALGDTVARYMTVPMLSQADGRRFAYQTIQPGQTYMLDISGEIGGAVAFNGCPASSFRPPPILPGLQQMPQPICLSHSRVIEGAPPGQPWACPTQGQPGADCTCMAAPGVIRKGVVWLGPLPPP